MKKILLTLMVFLAHSLAFAESAAPMLLGKNHAMKRVAVTARYLLLPVQEREDNATIRILADNRQVQKLNVRLAVDKVDYYVPLDVKRFGLDEVTLDDTDDG